MPLYSDEQKIEELKITFACKCGEHLSFLAWDESLLDDPYVDVECECGIYYKKMSSIKKNGGKKIKSEYTGKFL